VRGVGIDALSVDNAAPSETRSPSHKALHGADRYVLENLANLDRLPARDILLVIGALPVVDGTAGPARVLASVPAA
jgi:kynurenine formamidase